MTGEHVHHLHWSRRWRQADGFTSETAQAKEGDKLNTGTREAAARRLLLADLPGDRVEVALALRGDPAPLPPRHLLHDLQRLQLLENVARDRARRLPKVLRPRAAVDAAAEDLLEGADAGAGAQVDAPRDGGGADVVPVGIVRRELFVRRRLDEISPLGDLDLADPLEVGGVGDHEVVGGDVLHGDSA
eukprot:CAMPEP_0182819042 /NCGR_PEP_ID=MMETSP0006_2-20121128/12361_1 /TAXON_ID=97485 /ORGANISM="Prymnesium parvum, Strain Texoma1" /LENGTH=187 /DNA_ID=CAMNT_0024945577 /DNA_START=132 /DNA_END=692 /DNA_ORIENTATION=-